MKSVKTTEGLRVTRRFAGFYAISIGLLAIIFAGFTFGRSKALSPESSEALSAFSTLGTEEQETILSDAAQLQAAFAKLVDYDRQYLAIFRESGSSAQSDALRLNMENALETVREKAEKLKEAGTQFSVSTSVRLAERIADTYLIALEGRDNLIDLKSNNSELSKVDPSVVSTAVSNSDLLSRDKRIVELEKIVADLQNAPVNNGNELKQINEDMVAEASDVKNRLDKITQLAASLKTENTRLNERITEIQRGNEQKINTTAGYENKMESLTADLSFMEVDCSLTRADAKQIISNSRQRRELLSQALRTLKTLSQSPSPDIRRKAAVRIAALNNISKNIRE